MGTHSHLTVIKGGKRRDFEFTIDGGELIESFGNWLREGGPYHDDHPALIDGDYDTGENCEGSGSFNVFIDHDNKVLSADCWPDILHIEMKHYATVGLMRENGWTLDNDPGECWNNDNFKYECVEE